MSKGEKALHPEIISLVRDRDKIHSLLSNLALTLAADEMYLFIVSHIRPEHQDLEAIKSILKEVNGLRNSVRQIRGRGYPHTGALKLNYERKNASKYYDLYRRLNRFILSRDYLLESSYLGVKIEDQDFGAAEEQ